MDQNQEKHPFMNDGNQIQETTQDNEINEVQEQADQLAQTNQQQSENSEAQYELANNNDDDVQIQNSVPLNEQKNDQIMGENNDLPIEIAQGEQDNQIQQGQDGEQNQENQQDQQENQQDQQANQQEEDQDDDQNNQNLNPAQQYTNMISAMNNEPFLNEDTLEGIYRLLSLDSNEMFDEIDRKKENWQQQIESILKKRLEIYSKKVEVITNIYQDNIPSNSMRNIEKIMSIIKSKEKEIYIYKIDRSQQCCHHNHDQGQNAEPNKQTDQETHNEQPQQQDNQQETDIDLTKDLQENIDQTNNQEETQQVHDFQENDNQQSQSQEEQTTQADVLQNSENQQQVQNENNLNNELQEEELKENVEILEDENERMRLKLLENEEIRLRQEEQKRQLLEENQRLKKEYDSIVERNQKLQQDFNEQVHLQNYQLRKEATAQLQRLSESQQQNDNAESNDQIPQENNNNNEQNENNDQQIQDPVNQTEMSNQNEQSSHNHHNHEQHHNHNEQNEEDGSARQQLLLGQNFSISDIQSIMQMQFVDLQRLKKLNPVENSITFDMNDNYLIKIKSCDQIKYDRTSLCSKVPHFIFKEHIFSFLSSVELFRVRAVSPEWQEMVREIWHRTFKRDMQEQLLATDLCKEIEAQFKLMHIRTPFYQKLSMLIRAMVEVINWEDFERKCFDNQLNPIQKKVVVSVLRLLGYNFFALSHINEFQESEFEQSRVDISQHFRDFFYQQINNPGMSSQELKSVYQNFLTQADISISMFRNETDKNYILFILIAKQYFLYALLRNHVDCSQFYMTLAKNKLDSLSKDWPTSKGFLEGAYKILLLKNATVKDGQVVDNSDDEKEIKKPKKKKTVKRIVKKNKVESEVGVDAQQNIQEQSQTEQKTVNNQEDSTNTNIKTVEDKSIQQEQQDQVVENATDSLVQEAINRQDNIENSQISHDQVTVQNNQESVESQVKEVIRSDKDVKQDEEIEEEQQEDIEEEEDEDDEEEVQSQTELSQLMKSIFNFSKSDQQEPDIIIKRKSGLMKIFLDQGTKLDIILNTVISVGMQKMQKEVQQEATDILQGTKDTLSNLEQKFVENQQQIDEMKEKSKQLEQCLLEKQAELDNAQSQNKKLNEEFQSNISQIQEFEQANDVSTQQPINEESSDLNNDNQNINSNPDQEQNQE